MLSIPRTLLLTTLAALLAAPAAAAQPAPAPDASPIVVEGRRDQAREIRQLLDALPRALPDGHIARFEDKACPVVVGLAADKNAAIADRMRAVANAAGLRVGAPACAPNVVVIATADKARLLDYLERSHPYLLASLSRRDIAHLKADPAPTALWHLQATIASDGRRLTPDAVAGVIVNRTTERATRLRDFAHPSLAGAVLLVESRALVGLTPTQVADYAAMRAFTGLDPARIPEGGPRSILKVLDTPMGGETPITVTRWDIAFLRSLYDSDPNVYLRAQRAQIETEMAKDLARDAEAAAPK